MRRTTAVAIVIGVVDVPGHHAVPASEENDASLFSLLFLNVCPEPVLVNRSGYVT
jgi:hypothetical protein